MIDGFLVSESIITNLVYGCSLSVPGLSGFLWKLGHADREKKIVVSVVYFQVNELLFATVGYCAVTRVVLIRCTDFEMVVGNLWNKLTLIVLLYNGYLDETHAQNRLIFNCTVQQQ